MKAARLHEYGGVDKLIVEAVPDPTPGPGEVLVKIGGAGLNHLDVDLRAGVSRFPMSFPHIPGLELAGEIIGLGTDVEGWKIGDRVAPYLMGTDRSSTFARTGRENLAPTAFIGVTRPGAYAELSAIPVNHLIRTPDSMSDVEAAAFQIAFGTAHHMLFGRGRLRVGETVLINSVGSGIGSAAVQLARHAGATVIGTASGDDKLAKAADLGMHHGINYTETDIAGEVRRVTNGRGVDLVFEHVGGKLFQAGLDSLVQDGRLVTCGAHSGEVVPFDVIPFFRSQHTIIGSFVYTSVEYEEVLRLASLGIVKPVVHATVSLDNIQDAFRMMEGRGHFGKLVVVP